MKEYRHHRMDGINSQLLQYGGCTLKSALPCYMDPCGRTAMQFIM
jgi:hypothetical protein